MFFEFSQKVRWAFLCFNVTDLAFTIGRCVNPGLVNVLVKFSQWRGPETFAVKKESIVNHNVNSFDLFLVLLGGAILLKTLVFATFSYYSCPVWLKDFISLGAKFICFWGVPPFFEDEFNED